MNSKKQDSSFQNWEVSWKSANVLRSSRMYSKTVLSRINSTRQVNAVLLHPKYVVIPHHAMPQIPNEQYRREQGINLYTIWVRASLPGSSARNTQKETDTSA